ncbi:MAG: hypothetical protein AB3N16_14535 [Flavobacteriaceae bacterium]
MRRFFDFYLDASVHVALSTLCLAYATGIVLGVQVDVHYALFLFLGTIACYNFVKYGVEAEKYILVANTYHKNIQLFSFAALGLAGYHALYFSLETWLGIGFAVVLTGLYALPMVPKKRNLRSLGLLKIILVALVWALTTVMVVVVSTGEPLTWDVWVEGVQRFLLVLVLLIPFEIRDLKYDGPNLGTLPQRIGVEKSKKLGGVLTLVFFFLVFLKDDISHIDLYGKGIMSVLLLLSMAVTSEDRTDYHASFWVEGIPILWLVILYILEGWV